MFELSSSLGAIAEVWTQQTIVKTAQSSIANFEMNLQSFGSYIILQFELLKMLKEIGKRLFSYHIPYGETYDISWSDEELCSNSLRKVIASLESAADLGCKIIVLHPSAEICGKINRKARIESLCKSLFELSPVLASKNLNVALEVLSRFCLGNNAQEMLENISGLPGNCGMFNYEIKLFAPANIMLEEIENSFAQRTAGR